MYLFFDTETNGLPKDWKAPFTDLGNWPRIIQLAFVFCNANGDIEFEYKRLIKPDGWTIPKERFWEVHGYYTENNNVLGVPMQDALKNLCDAIDNTSLMVAHNLAFDYPVVTAEMLRYGVRPNNKPAKFCTMKSTTDICRIPQNGRLSFKWPKLEELHHFLFGEYFEGAHDALTDVRATARCFFELKRRNLIPL